MERKYCQCGNPIDDTNRFCPKCGRVIKLDFNLTCPQCKKEIKNKEKYCYNCGTEIKEVHAILLSQEQAEFINKWSWGCFLSSIIWCIGSKLYWYALLFLIPVVNIAVWIFLSIKGRKTSWIKGKWENFEKFEKRQKLLDVIAVILLGISILSVVIINFRLSGFVVAVLIILVAYLAFRFKLN